MHILHVIAGLETGGAELFLERLIQSLGSEGFQHHIVSISSIGSVGKRIQCRGTRVDALHYKGKADALPKLFQLGRLIRSARPDLVQGWLYHGNLAASVAMQISGIRCPLLWNVRHSLDQWAEEKWLLRGEIRFSGWLAGRPARIVFNSERSARQHERPGYPHTKACVIPNGFDLEEFAPNPAGRAAMRTQLGIAPDETVLGMIARYHPLKDHANFLRAASIVIDENPGVRFLLAGREVTATNRSLMNLIRELRLEDRVLLLGERDDIPELLNACDIYVSSSSSEAFPNAVGEAMSCGLPCVVTDAGDSAVLVADTGIMVPSQSPERLAEGMLQLTHAGPARRRTLGAAARERIRMNYSNESIARQYADLYRAVWKTTRIHEGAA